MCLLYGILEGQFLLSVWQSIGLLFPNLPTKINPTHNILLVYEKKRRFLNMCLPQKYVGLESLKEMKTNYLHTYPLLKMLVKKQQTNYF